MFQHKFVLYNAQSKKYYFNPVSKNIENKMSDICPLVNMTQLLVSGKSGQWLFLTSNAFLVVNTYDFFFENV